jgi:hypothetical protein
VACQHRVGMVDAEHPHLVGEHLPILGGRPRRIAGCTSPSSNVPAGRYRLRVVDAEHPDPVGEHLFVLGGCPRRIARRTPPLRSVAAGPHSVSVVRAEMTLGAVADRGVGFAGCGSLPGSPEARTGKEQDVVPTALSKAPGRMRAAGRRRWPATPGRVRHALPPATRPRGKLRLYRPGAQAQCRAIAAVVPVLFLVQPHHAGSLGQGTGAGLGKRVEAALFIWLLIPVFCGPAFGCRRPRVAWPANPQY